MARLHRANPESGIDHGLARRFLHEMSLIPRFEEKAGAVYRTREEVEREKHRDPVTRFADHCLHEGLLTAHKIED